MPEVRPISFTEHVAQATALLGVEHVAEVEPDIGRDGPQLALPIYETLERAGSLITLGAFDGDTMVGYSVAILGPHLHYGFTYAHHDMLYVAPAHRQGRLGLQLIRETEREAKARGARCVTWHVKPGSALDKILGRLGYAVEETVYLKEF